MTLTAPELPDRDLPDRDLADTDVRAAEGRDAGPGDNAAPDDGRTPEPVAPDSPLVLVDPWLPAATARHLLAALGRTVGVGVRCADRAKMIAAVRPGVVVVLTDAHPAIVGMLTRWGASVVAVLLEDAPVVPWLVDVVEEGASAALVRPDDAALADAVIGLLTPHPAAA